MKTTLSATAMILFALGFAGYANAGDNRTPGGCSDTYYGCNEDGEQHDPNDPTSVFSYEESCIWCVTERDREFAAVWEEAFNEGLAERDDPFDEDREWGTDRDTHLCEWDFKAVTINFCEGWVKFSVGPFTRCWGNCPKDDDSWLD